MACGGGWETREELLREAHEVIGVVVPAERPGVCGFGDEDGFVVASSKAVDGRAALFERAVPPWVIGKGCHVPTDVSRGEVVVEPSCGGEVCAAIDVNDDTWIAGLGVQAAALVLGDLGRLLGAAQ